MNHEGLEIKKRLPGVKHQVCKQENLNKKQHQVQDLGLTKFRSQLQINETLYSMLFLRMLGLGEKALPLIASTIKKIMLGLVEKYKRASEFAVVAGGCLEP